MNNPNPFLPHGAFLEQKNKARTRFKIAVSVSISLSVMVLMVLLIQGCKKPTDTAEGTGTDTNSLLSQMPTNPPETVTTSNTAMTPPVTNPPAYTPPPVEPPVAPPVATTEDYTIVPGDSFAKIAEKMHVSTKAIVDANPGVDAKKLKIGQKIHVPAPSTSAPTTSATTTSATMDNNSAGGMQTYKVKSGDNLTTIAKSHHVTIKAIQSANNLTTTSIKVGQVLKIPGAAAPAPTELPPPSLSAPTSAPAATTLPPPTH